MERLAEFVSQHINDDVTRLLLDRDKWPETDMGTVVNCIESRRKLAHKVPEWCAEPKLIFPARLSAEQCSSSATGRYKAALAGRIVPHGCKIADLTGGLGVDSWFFSQEASEVMYNEMQEILCKAAKHNFGILNATNITVSGHRVESGNIRSVLAGFAPDIVYMDPARRAEGGRKVFLIEECSPDILTLKDEIFSICRHIMVKLSPMADISMVCSRLGKCCREVHAVASDGECKELLIWMDREWDGEYTVIAAELPGGYPAAKAASFAFLPSEEKGCICSSYAQMHYGVPEDETFLFEPGKAMMKAGAFNLTGVRLNISKLGKSTHYYLAVRPDESHLTELCCLGKAYRVLECHPLDKRSIKDISKRFPAAEITARNIPMDTDTLRKKSGVIPDDRIHIFGLKSDTSGNVLIVTERYQANRV